MRGGTVLTSTAMVGTEVEVSFGGIEGFLRCDIGLFR